jgi:hypothetical protein
MPSPTSSLATQRPDLAACFEEFDLMMNAQGFIGQRVFPVFNTAKQAGNFGRIPIEQLLQNRETSRSPGASYNRGQWKFVPETYATEEHGAEEPIDDREAEMYADYFDAEVVSTGRAMYTIMESQERRCAAKLFNATTWTPTDVSNEWDDWDNATPIDDVEAAVLRVWEASGLWPNSLVINRKVFRNLRNCGQIIDRLKYNGIVDVRAENITAQALAQVFDLPQILVAGGAKNTADEGQTASISSIWSDEYASVCRIATTNDIREPCIGRIMHWTGDGSQVDGRVETYREEQSRSMIVRARHDVQEKTLHVEAADLIGNVTTIA